MSERTEKIKAVKRMLSRPVGSKLDTLREWRACLDAYQAVVPTRLVQVFVVRHGSADRLYRARVAWCAKKGIPVPALVGEPLE